MTTETHADDVAGTLRRIFVDSFGVDPSTLSPAATLEDDLGLDSLDLIAALPLVEDTFGITIADEEFASLRTVDDVVKLVRGKTE